MFSLPASEKPAAEKSARPPIRVVNKTLHDIVFPPIPGQRLSKGAADLAAVRLLPGRGSIPAAYHDAIHHLHNTGQCRGLVKAYAQAFDVVLENRGMPGARDAGPALEVLEEGSAEYLKPDGVDAPPHLQSFQEQTALGLVSTTDDPKLLTQWGSADSRAAVKEAVAARLKVLGGQR